MKKVISLEQNDGSQLQALERIAKLLERLYVHSPKCAEEKPLQRQGEIAQCSAESLPSQMLDQKIPDCRAQREPRLGQTLREDDQALSVFSVAWSYLRLPIKICKAILIASLVWIFLIGQPKQLWLGAVQILNCGWSSEVENVYTCDK
jgi:hypothetical protein